MSAPVSDQVLSMRLVPNTITGTDARGFRVWASGGCELRPPLTAATHSRHFGSKWRLSRQATRRSHTRRQLGDTQLMSALRSGSSVRYPHFWPSFWCVSECTVRSALVSLRSRFHPPTLSWRHSLCASGHSGHSQLGSVERGTPPSMRMRR